MLVRPIRYFADNYCYLLKTKNDTHHTIVDPGDTDFILDQIRSNNWTIDNILLTHRHWDHIGDFPKFLSELKKFHNEDLGLKNHKIDVYGGHIEEMEFDYIPICRTKFSNEKLDFENFTVECQHSPCHTRGHVLFYIEPKEFTDKERDLSGENREICEFNRILLSGDTLFIGGCGRFFEGSASEMAQNMWYMRSLHEDTAVFCGHDYFWGNFGYNWDTEWENLDLLVLKEEMLAREEEGVEKIPGRIGTEAKTNTFMRFDLAEMMEKMGTDDPVESLRKLRELKDKNLSYRKLVEEGEGL